MKEILALALVALAVPAFADDGDDTLKLYLSKSDLVATGKLAWNGGNVVVSEMIVNHYGATFEVDEVLKGDPTMQGQAINCEILRFEALGENPSHPLLLKREGAQCILFLSKGDPLLGERPGHWKSSDPWFAIQHPSKAMSGRLKRLAKQEVP